jgi:hypothetical protein
MSEHKIKWWVYATDGLGGREKIRHSNSMCGPWGYEASCSCGWETRSGGAIRAYIRKEVYWHKLEAGVL